MPNPFVNILDNFGPYWLILDHLDIFLDIRGIFIMIFSVALEIECIFIGTSSTLGNLLVYSILH